MKRFRFLFCAVLLSACSPVDSLKPFDQQQAAILLQENHTLKPARQVIAIDIPKQKPWQRIDLSLLNKGTPILLIPAGETQSNWTESIRTFITSYQDDPDISAQKIFDKKLARLKDDHCQMLDSTILHNDSSYLLYKITYGNCATLKNQTYIGKAFNGRDAVYLVYYTADNQAVSQQEISELTQSIARASLIQNPKYRY